MAEAKGREMIDYMKLKYVLLVAVSFSILFIASNTKAQSTCPAGTYDTGISKTDVPLCKIIPTGCPYGDSIPMDYCDTVKPKKTTEPVKTKTVVPKPSHEVEIDYGVGK